MDASQHMLSAGCSTGRVQAEPSSQLRFNRSTLAAARSYGRPAIPGKRFISALSGNAGGNETVERPVKMMQLAEPFPRVTGQVE